MSEAILMPAMISLEGFMCVTLVALSIRRVCVGVLHRRDRRTKTPMDDLLIVALRDHWLCRIR